MRRRLVRRGALAAVATSVVADLAARGYLDDAAFARQWVEARTARGYGAARLRAELRTRGIPEPLIEDALAAVPAQTGLDRCRALAQHRLPALGRAGPARAASRLSGYLLRRGYAASVVSRVVREVIGPEWPHGPGVTMSPR